MTSDLKCCSATQKSSEIFHVVLRIARLAGSHPERSESRFSATNEVQSP